MDGVTSSSQLYSDWIIRFYGHLQGVQNTLSLAFNCILRNDELGDSHSYLCHSMEKNFLQF